jgi:hypothetical protein
VILAQKAHREFDPVVGEPHKDARQNVFGLDRELSTRISIVGAAISSIFTVSRPAASSRIFSTTPQSSL